MPHEALREITWTMSFDRAGKTLANERKYPFIVEAPVAAKGLKVELSRQRCAAPLIYIKPDQLDAMLY